LFNNCPCLLHGIFTNPKLPAIPTLMKKMFFPDISLMQTTNRLLFFPSQIAAFYKIGGVFRKNYQEKNIF